MIAYHGSDSNFKKFKISKSLNTRRSTNDNEGPGIYFSTDIDIARTYGKYLYTIDINKAYLLDYRNKATCEKFVKELIKAVYSETYIRLDNYIVVDSLIMRMNLGGIKLYEIWKDLKLQLDNNYDFYRLNSKTKKETVYKILKRFNKEYMIAYMFTYHIQNIGVIKTASEDVVRILKKENSY